MKISKFQIDKSIELPSFAHWRQLRHEAEKINIVNPLSQHQSKILRALCEHTESSLKFSDISGRVYLHWGKNGHDPSFPGPSGNNVYEYQLTRKTFAHLFARGLLFLKHQTLEPPTIHVNKWRSMKIFRPSKKSFAWHDQYCNLNK